MNIHESTTIAVTVDTAALSPLFVPLLDLPQGTTVIASQSVLTVTGTASPLEVAVMLCKPGTLLGDPADAVLKVGEPFSAVAGQMFALAGSAPPLEEAGVVGLSVPVQGMPAGARVQGTFSTVR